MRKEVPVKNPAFDVTPKEYVMGYITEDGIKKR
jgi:methylthioribose-1-phosphate isomerase